MTQRLRSRLWGFAVIGAAMLVGVACAPSSADVSHGREVYAAQCQTCHGDAATGAGRFSGAPNHGPDGHTWHHPDQLIKDIVLGVTTYPNRTMPTFEGKLSDIDLADLLAYLKSNWTPAQQTSQATLNHAGH